MLLFTLMFYLVFVFIVLYKAVPCLKAPNKDYLGKQNTDPLKAICAIGVVMHHIVNEISCGSLFFPFRIVGFLMVAVFFFLSGYGLVVSMNNKSNYMEGFLKKRMTSILIPYFFAVIIYSIYYAISKEPISISDLFMQFVGGRIIVRNSWFVIVLIYLYLLFWVCFKIIKPRKISWVIFTVALVIVTTGFYLPNWSPAIIAFSFGIYFAKKKDIVGEALLKRSNICIIISLVLFAALMFLRMSATDAVEIILSMLCSVLFVFFVISLLTKIKIGNLFLSFLNRISFEMYLYHGLIMLILNRFEYICNNPMIYIVLTILLTIIVSYASYLLKRLLFKKILKKAA